MDETGTGRVEDIIEAMRILENGLSGVKRARANLLLSIPFYKTVPFCSRELYRWLNWDEETGWAKQFKWTEDRFKQTIGTVRELARKFEVDAVAVEKVSFVLERNGLIERFKTESITRSVFDEGRPVTTLNTAVRRVSGRKVGIEKEEVAMKQIYTPGGISPRVLAEDTRTLT
ncbi:hypothetical protein GQX73_g3387 [Xylaria multiplex]|uniref:Uncharacterized protein n=1 Tax=Xylaria multiplex TaxID=323545 RepID=A0A7C8ISQ1_9PEZI|nr:hypothetical protein GQX73_g3387 [Xylaria multiplex]